MSVGAIDRPGAGRALESPRPAAPTPRSGDLLGARLRPLQSAVVVAAAAGLGFLAADNPVLGIGLALVGLLGLAIAALPDVATLTVVAILYSNAAVIAVKLHGVPYFIGAAVPLLLVVPLGYLILVKRERIVTTPALPFVLGFLFVQVLGSLFSRNPSGALDDLATFLTEGIGLYFLITNVVRTSKVLDRAIWTLLAVGAFLGALSVLQFVTRSYGNDFWGFAQVSDAALRTGQATLSGDVTAPRLAGPIGEKNFYAQIMLMLVPLGFIQFWAGRTVPRRALAAGATVLITLGVALTYSRGAAVGYGIVLLAMVALRYIRPRQLLAVVALAIAVLVAFPTYAVRLATLDSIVDVASEGVASGADTSILSRATENVAAVLVFLDHPLVGVGPGLFPSYYRQYADQVAILAKNANRQAHSLYFGTAAETGILGMICFVGAIYVTLRDLDRARRRWRGIRPDLANVAAGFLLALVAYLATGIFLHSAYLRYFWLLMALGAAATLIAEREGAQAPTPVNARPAARAIPAGAPRPAGRPPASPRPASAR